MRVGLDGRRGLGVAVAGAQQLTRRRGEKAEQLDLLTRQSKRLPSVGKAPVAMPAQLETRAPVLPRSCWPSSAAEVLRPAMASARR